MEHRKTYRDYQRVYRAIFGDQETRLQAYRKGYEAYEKGYISQLQYIDSLNERIKELEGRTEPRRGNSMETPLLRIVR